MISFRASSLGTDSTGRRSQSASLDVRRGSISSQALSSAEYSAAQLAQPGTPRATGQDDEGPRAPPPSRIPSGRRVSFAADSLGGSQAAVNPSPVGAAAARSPAARQDSATPPAPSSGRPLQRGSSLSWPPPASPAPYALSRLCCCPCRLCVSGDSKRRCACKPPPSSCLQCPTGADHSTTKTTKISGLTGAPAAGTPAVPTAAPAVASVQLVLSLLHQALGLTQQAAGLILAAPYAARAS